ncbi:MAG: extracellular solute-binding protein [Blautia sp.]|nr:extracellular solute-binding protein [Blautia sp.]
MKVYCPQNQVDTGIMEQQQQAFAAAHPEYNITWTTEIVGEDKCAESILKDVGAAADVFMFANDQLPSLVEAGAIARLGGEAESMVKETNSESVLATVTVDDAVYAIPFTHNTFFMFYDKTLLDESDITSLEKIMAKDTADNVYNFYFESAGGWKLGAFYYGAGLSVFGSDGNDLDAGVDWNNATGVAVTNYLIDLINNPKCAYDGEISVSELAGDHRIGAWFDGSWNYDLYKGILGDDLGLAVIPTFNFDGTDHQLLGFYGSKCIGVNAKSQNMAATVQFPPRRSICCSGAGRRNMATWWTITGGLIRLRKKLPGLCDKSASAVERITGQRIYGAGVVSFQVDNRPVRGSAEWDELFIVYNASSGDCAIPIPDGVWEILADGRETDCRRAVEESRESIRVEAHSGMLLGNRRVIGG